MKKEIKINLFDNLNGIAKNCTNTKNISKFGSKITDLAIESIFHILKFSSKVNQKFFLSKIFRKKLKTI